MSYVKIATVVKRLHDKTNRGDVRWEQTSKEGIFRAAFPGYSVLILPRDAPEGAIDYVVQIFDDEGALLEEVADPDLKDFLTDPFKLMRTIYETARRSAMGVEQALNRILGALGDERPPS
jgi:hypothetical protein